jgi:hypothetical protein
MQTQDRREQLFERLCLYRAMYERRGRLDSTSVISVETALGWAEELMRDPDLLSRVVSRRA